MAALFSTPAELLIDTNIESAHHMAVTQYTEACRHDQYDLLMFKLSTRMGEKGDLRDFESGMKVVCWCQKGWCDYFTNC